MQMMSSKTNEKLDLVNQDSMILCSNIDGILTKEDDIRTDNSHIQIKYAKMLEELDYDCESLTDNIEAQLR